MPVLSCWSGTSLRNLLMSAHSSDVGAFVSPSSVSAWRTQRRSDSGGAIPRRRDSVRVSTLFAFCLDYRVSYEQAKNSDFSKLATIDREGRSSAVKVLSASVVEPREFEPRGLPERARELLTFVGNLPQVSLQAAKCNEVTQLALKSTAAVGFDMKDFAANLETNF